MSQATLPQASSWWLPAPRREVRESGVVKTMADWSSQIVGESIFARVPRVDQELIDNGELFVEFGLVRDKRYSNKALNTHKWRRVTRWSSWVASTVITWTGEWGWAHQQIWVDRPNRFPVVGQNDLHWELPWFAFYRLAKISSFDETNTLMWSNVPIITGSKIKRLADPSNYLPGGSNYQRRPKYQRFRDEVHQDSEWYARLVVVKEGRLEAVWPISEPLFIDVEWGFAFSNDVMDSTSRPSLQWQQVSYKANANIWHKYKH